MDDLKIACVLCGEDCACCLEFHHRDPNEKDFTVTMHLSSGFAKIKAEIDKCVVLCANCHKKVHAGIVRIG